MLSFTQAHLTFHRPVLPCHSATHLSSLSSPTLGHTLADATCTYTSPHLPTGAFIMLHSSPYMPSSSHTLMSCLILSLHTLPHHFTPMLHFLLLKIPRHTCFFLSLNICEPNLTVNKQQEVMNSFYGCVMVSAITYPIPSISYHRNKVQSQ